MKVHVGHVMSKAYQYITDDDKNLLHWNWKTWVWRKFKLVYRKPLFKLKNFENEKQEWKYSCLKNGMQHWKLKIHVKIRFANKVIMFEWTFQFKECHNFLLHHKLHGSQFDNNNHVKFSFHRFIWNKHGCHSSICTVEHWCHVHCLDTNVICLFALFKHECYVFICIIYKWKLCTQIPCLNNAWHSCVNNTNPWNNIVRIDLERAHEASKFMMYGKEKIVIL